MGEEESIFVNSDRYRCFFSSVLLVLFCIGEMHLSSKFSCIERHVLELRMFNILLLTGCNFCALVEGTRRRTAKVQLIKKIISGIV